MTRVQFLSSFLLLAFAVLTHGCSIKEQPVLTPEQFAAAAERCGFEVTEFEISDKQADLNMTDNLLAFKDLDGTALKIYYYRHSDTAGAEILYDIFVRDLDESDMARAALHTCGHSNESGLMGNWEDHCIIGMRSSAKVMMVGNTMVFVDDYGMDARSEVDALAAALGLEFTF